MNEMERLQAIMQKEELNSKDFAAEVGISPATMSNIVNGRNKPSLEVMQKILLRFRALRSDWLILGTGSMYRMNSEATEQTLFDIKPEVPITATHGNPVESASVMTGASGSAAVINPVTQQDAQAAIAMTPGNKKSAAQILERPIMVEKKVTKIMVFFDDGTFQELGA